MISSFILLHWTYDEVVRAGDVNQLGIAAQDGHFRFLINGKSVATLDDSRFPSGHVGAAIRVAQGGSLSVAFDDFSVQGASD
jgi:hypothetical protein